MYYKILPETKLFAKLSKLKDEMMRCNEAALALVKSAGYESFRIGWHVLAGGISAVQISGGCPYGWKRASKRMSDAYLPSNISKNKELLHKIESLPTVTASQLNSILKFEEYLDNVTNSYYEYPYVAWEKNVILVRINDTVQGYKPLKEMVEITFTEFTKLNDHLSARKSNKK